MSVITNFIEKHSQGTRLTLTAIAASVLTASAVLGYQTFTRSRIEKTIKTKSIDAPIAIVQDQIVEPAPMDESLVLELLARNIAFFGPENVNKIRQSFVVVLGSGAIGSWTALMLVRSGVERVRIVDRGLIRLESLSRHAVATVADIGKSKAEAMKRSLATIAPHAHVEAVRTELTQDNLSELLRGEPDYVVDTLSDLKDKVMVADYCCQHNLKLVSAMSAGSKADPSLIQVTDISDATADPLARTYKRQLRKLGMDRGIPVVYSIEKNLHVNKVPDFRTRALPVLGPIASMFGMALVTFVIVQLGEFTAYQLPANKMRDGVYARMQKELAAKEEYVFHNKECLDVKDIGYIFDELWQGKSVISGAQDRMLVMTRWDNSKKTSLTNTVVMTKEEAAVHDTLSFSQLVDHYGADVVERVRQQIELEEKLQRLWKA
ncbi:uncharacterized protein B0P05DRAFT_594468 [Gilbertella persicaria]|uniref:uncharacterized protein n=1 Tax=Gilbertella persicaria TaxID=101096 RepID=UPI00221E77AA|nr:uncharacterized protein B0P05DRAFT_594468 [Gilbertella persicaria]KAI8090110.1 hypothetical protein B0P05DRAFT_594468 [Gilbertella persicaria]